MKTSKNNLFLLPTLIVALSLIPTGSVTAQTFTTLHSFTAVDTNSFNSDGVSPNSRLILSGNTLYGTARYGGSAQSGTVFAINTGGTYFTNLHSFIGISDGANPVAELLLSSNTLYGTAVAGGSSGSGTVFKVNTDGTGFTNLHSFTANPRYPPYGNSDGALPNSRLLLSGNTLYGTAGAGGSSGNGTVFAVNTDGTGFTNLHSFTATSGSPPYGNSDGASPNSGLLLSGNTLYGTASVGGSSGNGTMFAINTDGTGLTNLHSFTATSGSPPYGNSDGARPFGALVLSGNTLYGATFVGGASGQGAVFAVNTNGTGFTNLYNFTATQDNSSGYYTNSGGAQPSGGLILSGNTLYGTAYAGGSSGNGTVFAVKTNGMGFTMLHDFTATPLPYLTNNDGAGPYGGVVLSGNTLYGTVAHGGSSGNGTVFSLALVEPINGPQLTIVRSGPNVILTWPTNAAGFNLQSTLTLGLAAGWTNVVPEPVVANGQNTVTNPVSGTQNFYRLSQ